MSKSKRKSKHGITPSQRNVIHRKLPSDLLALGVIHLWQVTIRPDGGRFQPPQIVYQCVDHATALRLADAIWEQRNCLVEVNHKFALPVGDSYYIINITPLRRDKVLHNAATEVAPSEAQT